MHFSIQLTRGTEHAVVGAAKDVEASSPIRAGAMAKSFLVDARASGEPECPDGYSIYDADGDWVETYRAIAKAPAPKRLTQPAGQSRNAHHRPLRYSMTNTPRLMDRGARG